MEYLILKLATAVVLAIIIVIQRIVLENKIALFKRYVIEVNCEFEERIGKLEKRIKD